MYLSLSVLVVLHRRPDAPSSHPPHVRLVLPQLPQQRVPQPSSIPTLPFPFEGDVLDIIRVVEVFDQHVEIVKRRHLIVSIYFGGGDGSHGFAHEIGFRGPTKERLDCGGI